MIAEIAWGAGLVLTLEGLALALAPRRLDEALEALRRMPPDARRLAGLAALAAGAALLTLSRALLG